MLSRALYAVWHAALVGLAADLKGKLQKHAVTGPLAPAMPWDGRAVRAEAGPQALSGGAA